MDNMIKKLISMCNDYIPYLVDSEGYEEQYTWTNLLSSDMLNQITGEEAEQFARKPMSRKVWLRCGNDDICFKKIKKA